MENLKNYNEFITEDKSIDKFGYTGVDITDDLKSNFRSWEKIAYDWVGYKPKGEEE